MNKSYKFDGSQTGTYSQYVPNRYIGFKVAMFTMALGIIALVSFAVMYL